MEPVSADQFHYLRRAIVGHEEVHLAAGKRLEKLGVVNVVVGIETRAGALSAGRIGRINEPPRPTDPNREAGGPGAASRPLRRT